MRMKTLTISVTEHQASLLEEAVAEGKFASDSEAVRAALTLWEKREAAKAAEVEWLRREIQAGIDSGEAKPLDREAFFAEVKSRRAKRA